MAPILEIEQLKHRTFTLRRNMMIFLWFQFFWTFYLRLRQLVKLQGASSKPKEFDKVTCEKYYINREYALRKTGFQIVHSLYTTIFSSFELWYGFYEKYCITFLMLTCDSEILQCIHWHVVLNTIYIIVDLPMVVLNWLLIDRIYRHRADYIVYYAVKQFLKLQLVSLPTSVLANIILTYGGRHVFSLVWLGTVLVTFFFMTVYIQYIHPFYKLYIQMPEGALKDEIVQLALQLNFPLQEIYIIHGHHRPHNYVEYCGAPGGKRLAIYDDIINLKNCEIIAIIAHELGHWYYDHYYKLFFILSIYYFVICLPLKYVISCPFLYTALGFPYNFMPVFIGLTASITYILTPINEFCNFFVNTFTRRFQYDADALVVKIGLYESLKRALNKLNSQDTVSCVYDPVYSCWYMDHPTVQERLMMIEKAQERHFGESDVK